MPDVPPRDRELSLCMRTSPSMASALIAVLVMLVATGSSAHARAEAATLAHPRVIKTWRWSRPSPDPTGLTFRRGARNLLVSDSEVDEIPALWRKRNLFITGQRGRLLRSRRVTARSREPEDIAWDPRRRRLYVTDDDRDRVFRFIPGKDRRIGTADDRASTVLRTRRFGSGDPEGLAFRVSDRSFFVTDPTRERIYHVKRGRDRRFNTPDDVVTSFASSTVGIGGPEGIEYEGRSKHLYIVGSAGDVVAVTTVKGMLVTTIDLSLAGIVHPSAITIAPSSPTHPRTRVFITDRGVDNGRHPSENDGRLLIFVLRR